jgi:aspartate racemase
LIANPARSASSTRLFVDAGADAVLLAGTDLGLALHGITPRYRVLDALDIHADAMVAKAKA